MRPQPPTRDLLITRRFIPIITPPPSPNSFTSLSPTDLHSAPLTFTTTLTILITEWSPVNPFVLRTVVNVRRYTTESRVSVLYRRALCKQGYVPLLLSDSRLYWMLKASGFGNDFIAVLLYAFVSWFINRKVCEGCVCRQCYDFMFYFIEHRSVWCGGCCEWIMEALLLQV